MIVWVSLDASLVALAIKITQREINYVFCFIRGKDNNHVHLFCVIKMDDYDKSNKNYYLFK